MRAAVLALAFLSCTAGGSSVAPRGYRLELVAGSIGGCGYQDGIGREARFGGRGYPGIKQGLDLVALPDGTLLVADALRHSIRRVTPDGEVSTVWGDPTVPASRHTYFPSGLAVDGNGDIYIANGRSNLLRVAHPDGSSGEVDVGFMWAPVDIAFDGAGRLVFATDGGILRREANGDVTHLAGAQGGIVDGTGLDARFESIVSIALSSSQSLYVVDYNTIRKVTPAGVVTTVAGAPTAGYVDATGSDARFSGPTHIAVDANENLYVTDQGNGRLRKITPAGVVSTIEPVAPESFWEPDGIAVNADGTLFVGDRCRIVHLDSAGNVTPIAGSNPEYGYVDGVGDGARFGFLLDLAVANGVIYVADYGGWIRQIAPDGTVTTLVATAAYPQAIAADSRGNLAIVENSGSGPFFGRVSFIDASTHEYRTLVERSDRRMSVVTMSPAGKIFYGTVHSTSQYYSRDLHTTLWRLDGTEQVEMVDQQGDGSELYYFGGLAIRDDEVLVLSRSRLMSIPATGGNLTLEVDFAEMGARVGGALTVGAKALYTVSLGAVRILREDGELVTIGSPIGDPSEELGIVLGTSPRLNAPTAIAIDGDTLVIADGQAVLRLVPVD